MFFTTKDKEEEIMASLDPYNDSFARDTTDEELVEVSTVVYVWYNPLTSRRS
jgi:hypothetical protein